MTAYQKQLTTAKAAIRPWLHLFTDQRLAEVYAFNQDGHMRYNDPCACLCGVFSAKSLHARIGAQRCPEARDGFVDFPHYELARRHHEAGCAEAGYYALGVTHGFVLIPNSYASTATPFTPHSDALRRVRLSPMLRAEMRRRERLAAYSKCSVSVDYGYAGVSL
jgi:hypothetical protein